MRGLRAALYTVLYAGGRVLSAGSAVILHLAAGLVRLPELQGAAQRAWDEVEALDLESYITSGLLDWEQEFYLPFLKPDDRILLIGCGTGRDLLGLLERGYRTDGLDSGPRLTAIASAMVARRGWSAAVLTGAIETVALPAPYDVAIFSWYCYCYVPHAENRIAVLRKVRAHLNPEGRVLIPYIPFEPGRRRDLLPLTRLVARLSRSDWRPEPGDYINHDGPGRYISHFEHQFRRDEIESEARAAGFTVLAHERKNEGRLALTR
jgi:SAM-dependent methyltransferase